MDPGFHVLDSSLCQWNLDSGFKLYKDSGFQVLDSGFFVSRTWIPNFSRQHDSPKPGFLIPQAKISRIPESGLPYIKRLAVMSRVATMHFLTK